ncbi:MAG: signal peptide peptidase SppA [Chloroflexota bacterium]
MSYEAESNDGLSQLEADKLNTQTVGPSPVVIRDVGNSRTPLWVLIGVSVGFLLPVCACGILFLSLSLVGGASGSLLDTPVDGGTGPAVAVVRVEGAIIGTDDTNYLAGAGSGTINAELARAEADEDVKAIVLRVDSPGGTVTGSAQIHEYLRDEVSKPVVVSMANVAASGGYYISTAADYIMARRETTTGSLGVILTLYDVNEFLDEWGVDVISVTSGPNKSIGNPWENLTSEQEEILQSYVNDSYDQFVGVIVEGRELDESLVREIADGRIYNGNRALEIGLIDEIGNFEQAKAKAAELGGIAGDPRIIEYERTPDYTDLLTTIGGRANLTEAEEMLRSLEEIMVPELEYRYYGR